MSPDPRTLRLARLTVTIVLGRWEQLRAVRSAAPAGEPDRAWREAVLQAHLFAGFPRLVEAYGVLEEAGGLGELEPGEAAPEDPLVTTPRGRELFERIYGAETGRVRAALERRQPLFAAWIEAHAYGRVLSRGGLDPARRELLACCALAATGQERQLASHARGAMRCGATQPALLAALEEVSELIAPERVERALRVIERFA
jgi:4-carboxymuconolactone decarboxylase